jgi:SAM-dependent methyltransferase
MKKEILFQAMYNLGIKRLEKKIRHVLSVQPNEQIANQRGAITWDESDAIATDVQKKLRCRESDRILEIGCGTGLIAERIAKDLRTYIGLDIIYDLLKSAKRNNTSINTNFLQGDGQVLPIKSGVIDRVLMYNVILYLPPLILKSILRECKRVLKPGGVLLIGDIPDPHNLLDLVRKQSSDSWRVVFLAMNRMLVFRLRKFFNQPGGGWYSPEGLHKILLSHGFVGVFMPQGASCPFGYYRYDFRATLTEG